MRHQGKKNEHEPKQYTSVPEMLSDLSGDESLGESVAESLRDSFIVNTLFGLRAARNITQHDIAKHLKCSQSKISKIENGTDDELKLGELEAYAEALSRDVDIVLKPKDMSLTDEVKFHAFRMKRCLDQLAKLPGNDHKIADGIAGFLGEAFFNLVNMLNDSASLLPNRSDDDGPFIRITIEDISDDVKRVSEASSDDDDGLTADTIPMSEAALI